MFEHERLEVYRFAVEFDELIVKRLPKRGNRAIREQLERASLSIMLNIAEGAGRFAPAEKRRFYAIARGSATECAACVDALSTRSIIDDDTRAKARKLLLSLVRMLSRLATSAPWPEPEPETFP
jgi:four helix bundle protein